MNTLTVDTLTFEFPDGWPVIKYDDCSFYRRKFGNPEDTKAVDVLAIGNELFIIEAKDFRGFRIQNKQRTRNNELALEMAKKIRDTLAILYGARRQGNEELKAFSGYLYDGTIRRIKIILVLEEDRPRTRHKSFRAIRSSLLEDIKRRLRFVDARCNLHTRADVPGSYAWTVR